MKIERMNRISEEIQNEINALKSVIKLELVKAE